MNKEEILALESGRTLDEIICTKIFNVDVEKKKRTFQWVNVPDYSKDISKAWKVLEEFEEYDVRKYVSAANEIMYECVITIKGVSVSCINKNAPLAICKAALLAVMDS